MWKTKHMKSSCTLLTLIYLHPLLFHNTYVMPLLIIHMYHFQAWILQHYPRIYGSSYVDTYIKDMSRVCAFTSLRRNQTAKPFRVYLDHMAADDIHFQTYVDHY